MPQRSTVSLLPEEIRQKLNKKLVSEGFQNYQELTDWLCDLGYEISKSALHRYGKQYEEQLFELKEATEQARGLIEACGDDENALAEAVTRLTHQKALKALLSMNMQDIDVSVSSLPALGKMVADLNKSSVSLKRYQFDVRKRLDEKFKVLEAEGKTGNIDPETLRRVREEVYGLF
jgi:DNA repair ATPase RecN